MNKQDDLHLYIKNNFSSMEIDGLISELLRLKYTFTYIDDEFTTDICIIRFRDGECMEIEFRNNHGDYE